MNGDSFSPDEQDLIRRLQDVPKSRLSARTLNAIRRRMLAEMDAPALQGTVRFPAARRPWLLTGTAALFTLIVAAAILVANRPRESTVVTVTTARTSVAAGQTAATPTAATLEVSPTLTLSPTATDEPVTPRQTAATATEVSPSPTLSPTQTSTPASDAPTAAPTLEMVIALEGPIEQIEGNTLTIYGIEIALVEGNPMLSIIEVGDMVRVTGGFDQQAGLLVATSVENLLDDEDNATVSLDGPIEAIEGDLVTVNGIEIVLAPAVPAVDSLALGDFLSVRGNIEMRGNQFVLVALSVDVLDNVEVATPTGCYYHEDAMGMGMGHWHCDGMGMGMGMGMGAPQ